MSDTWTLIDGYTASDYSDTLVFEVDSSTKELEKIAGQTLVAGEENSQYIRIQMDRYWDGIDISSKTIQVMYALAGEYYGTSDVVSAEYTDDAIQFGWIVPAEACCVQGTLLFCVVITDTDYALKTQIASTIVYKTIDIDSEIPEPSSTAWYIDFQNRVDATLENAETTLAQAQNVLEIARSYVGAPYVASTASDMTDTNRIYVYVGSENGYTNGNWYYYDTDNSAWTSGGVYNAVAVETDTTLTQDGVPADAKATGDAISSLNAEITAKPSIVEPEETEADLYVCDANGNVLVEFADGHIKTKNFDSSNIASGLHEEQEINLASYEQVSYNLENGTTWAYSTEYKGILIPASDLSYTNRFYSTTYKMRFAFLRSSEIVANTVPDYCMGTGLNTLNVGLSKYYELPSDCKYVYVYVSNGTYFGQMGLTRMSDNFDVVSAIRNSERPVFVTSVEQSLLTSKHMNSGVLHGFVASNVSDNLLTFAHISDLHNDPTNYTRFLNLLNEHDDIIDFGVVSGDLVDSGSSANFAEMVGCESVLNGNVPVYKCMGNHETGMTLANIYTAYQPGSGDGSLYFSKDFSTQKIRVIFLNQYDNEASTRGNTGHYSQTQIDWFISQLSDAITNNMSVIVVLHSMGEAGWPLYNKSGFYQQVLGDMYGAVNSAPIISDIINAFKHRKALNKTYTYTDGDGSLNVNVTFSGYGKFICYIAGHEHVDVIGYSQIYPDQLICLVQGGVVTSSTRTEAQAHWQSKYDTPRIANTVTSDSINVYSIDTVQKIVKVVKVGSTVTDKFETRSFAVFGY